MFRFIIISLLGVVSFASADGRTTREILYDLVLDQDPETSGILGELSDLGDPFVSEFYDAWRTGDVYTLDRDGSKTVIQQTEGDYIEVLTGTLLSLGTRDQAALTKARPARKVRSLLKPILDTLDLASIDASTRIDAARKLGQSQIPEYLPILHRRLDRETDSRVKRAIEEAIYVSLLENAGEKTELKKAIIGLGNLHSVGARDKITAIQHQAETNGDAELADLCRKALKEIEEHKMFVDMAGNLVRGFSLGSVLLIASFGLAITFGLMGIINMAHGEFIAIGGYTCYVVQNLFASWFGPQSAAYQSFFFVSLPISFLVAAGIGYIFERSFIRFLYRRPLESLLATWGLSMVMQQVFRLIFGAANVSVNTPSLLEGSYSLGGVELSGARLFLIAFAFFIVICTWTLLTKTHLGLFIRAVMQNRNMASSLGIPVSRVNSMTFAIGCGLAALAGAGIALVGNVGPGMGQNYIVDCFMVVVAGSVGNLLGAGVSAMGIGVVDQYLQPSLGPVDGKITVFIAIILFLQWKPGGLFPTKSRSLDD